jgi:hypothetical protein
VRGSTRIAIASAVASFCDDFPARLSLKKFAKAVTPYFMVVCY